MLLKIFKNRTVSSSGTWGTKNENNYEILNFEFPEELEEYNKRIVYYLDDTRVWDAILDNKAILTNAITTKGSVKAYVWCTKTDAQYETDVDFRTQLFEMNFFENENASGIVPTPEQVDGFNTMLTAMNDKIEEMDALETSVEQAEETRQANETTRQNNEQTRQNNETTRQENEQTRQEQEADRERRTDEAIGNIEDKTAEYNANAEAKTNAFNQNATDKTNTFNSNATSKTNDFNTNASNKTTAFNNNATQKTNDFNSNATSKTDTFNSNATSKTNTFNDNASSKTIEFNTNASDKTTAFDNNASSKTSDFNTNAENKTTDFNNNATQKTTDFNNNAIAKTEEFYEHTAEMQQEIDELSANMPWGETEQATEIQVTDAAKYSRNKLQLFGNTSQDTSKITYKCDGTETGDYYLTYNSTDYYFTMPTITSGDILVFDTTELKLYLNDTEIVTSSTGTGTSLTFIDTPNPDCPQDIHVVTGNNTIRVQGKNLFNKDNYNIKSLSTAVNTSGGSGTYTAATNQKHIYIPCKPSTDYVVVKDVSNISVLGIYETAVEPATNVSYTCLYFSSSSNGKRHITTSANAQYLDIRINTDAITQYEIDTIVSTLLIAEGTDTNISYEPYYHADYPVNLGSIELCKIGDYQDYFYKENGNWYKYAAIYKFIWNGGTIRTTGNHFYIYVPKRCLRSLSNCADRYIWVSYSSGFNNLPNFHIGMEGTGTLHIQDQRFTTAAELRAEYEQNPLKTYMRLETPEAIQITDETLISQLDAIYEHLQLIKGINNITITASDLAPYMKLNYMQDLPSKLDNIDSRLALLE